MFVSPLSLKKKGGGLSSPLLFSQKEEKKGGGWTSLLGQIEIGGARRVLKGRKEGEDGVAFPTGAEPHFGRAIHTGSPLPPPKVRISFRLDVGWDGGRWDGATKGEGGEFRGGEEMRKEGGEGERERMQKGRGPGVRRVLQIIQLAPRIKVCIFIAAR